MFFHMRKYHSTVVNMTYVLTNVHNDEQLVIPLVMF